MHTNNIIDEIVLGGGCFWCLEAVFKDLIGVNQVISGYAGGNVQKPSYKEVCNGSTGHAEVVLIKFDPKTVSLINLLEVFFSIHDPTTKNRQGADVGSQYRSIILYQNETQKLIAESLIVSLNQKNIWSDKIVTELKPLDIFYPAEDYHQNYFENNPMSGYCQVVINPKLNKFRQKYASLLKPD
jgi:peptide-methionine (S)-S-oxide reductase